MKKGLLAKMWALFLEHSLWCASIGVMLASSGIDGAYMARLMEPKALGYILNTVSDVCSMILMYWYGRLIQARSPVQQRRARYLLIVEGSLVFFSWLFGWRQIEPRIFAMEPDTAPIWAKGFLAMVVAAFTPVTLVGIGYAQSLLAGKIELSDARSAQETIADIQPVTQPVHKSRRQARDQRHTVSRRAQLLELWRARPRADYTTLAQELGVSRQTISNDFTALSQQGLVSRNGNGVVVNLAQGGANANQR